MITFIDNPDQATSLQSGSGFRFTTKPTLAANATFIAPLDDKRVLVTRYAADVMKLPDDTQVVAHWHGQRRTDAFLMTVREMKAKAKEQGF